MFRFFIGVLHDPLWSLGDKYLKRQEVFMLCKAIYIIIISLCLRYASSNGIC